ncbi:unnamed protein product, partial [Dibothriocephalus latus]
MGQGTPQLMLPLIEADLRGIYRGPPTPTVFSWQGRFKATGYGLGYSGCESRTAQVPVANSARTTPRSGCRQYLLKGECYEVVIAIATLVLRADPLIPSAGSTSSQAETCPIYYLEECAADAPCSTVVRHGHENSSSPGRNFDGDVGTVPSPASTLSSQPPSHQLPTHASPAVVVTCCDGPHPSNHDAVTAVNKTNNLLQRSTRDLPSTSSETLSYCQTITTGGSGGFDPVEEEAKMYRLNAPEMQHTQPSEMTLVAAANEVGRSLHPS